MPQSNTPSEPNAQPAAHDPYAALRLREFRLYLAGWVLSVIGQQLQFLAITWEIYGRTHDKLSLGWIGLVQAGPVILLALPAGHLADWGNRKIILIITQTICALCSLSLAWVSFNHGSVAAMYMILLASATSQALSWASRSALLPQIVPPDKFANAVSWYSSTFQIAAVTGPALGGFIIGFRTWPAYVTDAAFCASFALMVSMVPLKSRTGKREAPSLQSLAAGVRFVWKTKIILALITLDLFAVLLGGATYLLPAVAKDILHVGAFQFGCLRASFAIGAFLMALVNAHLPPFKHAGRAMLWAVAGFGAATIVFGLSKNYWLSLTMLFLAGACDNISVLVRHTLVQLLTPDEMRGRVSAVNNVFIGASNELGGFESGMTAYLFGTVVSIVGGGIGTIIVVILAALIWPEVRKFGSLHDAKPTD